MTMTTANVCSQAKTKMRKQKKPQSKCAREIWTPVRLAVWKDQLCSLWMQ